jgi:hypothetical protein
VGHQPNREALQQDLANVRGPLEDWRRRKSGRDAIPTTLWDKAVELASRHGVGAVAAGLRLDHAKLKSKLAEATKATVTLPVPAQRATPVSNAFVELFGSASPSSPSVIPARPTHVVRFRSPRGVQVRLDWGDSDVSGLAMLLREVL